MRHLRVEPCERRRLERPADRDPFAIELQRDRDVTNARAAAATSASRPTSRSAGGSSDRSLRTRSASRPACATGRMPITSPKPAATSAFRATRKKEALASTAARYGSRAFGARRATTSGYAKKIA